MKKYDIFLGVTVTILLFFGIQVSVGQNPLAKQWDYRYGGPANEFLSVLLKTNDGGFLLAGYSTSGIGGDKSQQSQGGADYWIVKTDGNGLLKWEKDFGGSGADNLTAAGQTKDGGFILGGYSFSDSSGDKTQNRWGADCDFWIIKTDSSGNKEWDKNFGGIDKDELNAIFQTSDGGYILGGSSSSGAGGDKTQPSFGNDDFWILKTDSTGILQWDKSFGGTGEDALFSLQQTHDGGYILGGYSISGISGNKTQPTQGTTDFWAVKLDATGSIQWDNDLGSYDVDMLINLQQTADDGYILGGISKSGIGGDKTKPNRDSLNATFDYWVVKLDSSGNTKWNSVYGGNSNEELYMIRQTSDKGFLISGTSYSPVSGDKTESNLGIEQTWVVKTDSAGIKQWDKTLRTASSFDDEMGLAVESGNGYVMANYTDAGAGGDKTQTSQGGYDFWIIRYNDSLQTVSQISFVCSDTFFCGKQCIDFYDLSINNPASWQWSFPGGIPSSSTDQNPVGICYNSYGSFDVTLIACNANGCDTLFLPDFIKEFQNPSVPIITWIADTLFSTPAYAYQWYFNSNAIPGATNQYYAFQQPGDYFVIVSDSNGCSTSSAVVYTGMDEPASDNGGIYVIPNPTDGNFILYGAPVNSEIKIYDVEGRVIYSGKMEISPGHLKLKASDGIYFLEINTGKKVIKKKIIMKNQ